MAYTLKLGLCNKLCNAVLSGKPTFMSVLLNDGWVTANDPKQAHKKTTRRWFRWFLVARGGIDQDRGCLTLVLGCRLKRQNSSNASPKLHRHSEHAELQAEYHLMHETILAPLGDPTLYHLAW